jgi:hypothetical protein
MAAPIMVNLSRLLNECQCLPRDVLVEKLIEDKDIEQLTNLKLQLYEKCKNIKGFPCGEFYQRRKPKGKSHYSSLEERLADDVYELMTCLDTEVITPEIKAMIKQNYSLVADNGNESQSALMPNNEPHNSSVIINRSSGWSGVKSKVASLEAGQVVFRERLNQEIDELSIKISNLVNVVEAQCEEINLIKVENELQREEIKAIKVENEELRLRTNKNPVFNAEGENKTYQKHCGDKSPTSHSDCVNVDSHEIESNQTLIKNSLNNTAHEQTNRSAVSKNHDNQSNEVEMIHAEEQSFCSNVLTGKEDQPVSDEATEKPSTSTFTQRNNLINAPQSAKQQNLTYAEVVEQHPASSTTAKNNEKATFRQKQGTIKQSQECNNGLAGDSNNEFTGVERKRNKIKSFFLSGIAQNVTESQVLSYLKERNVIPTQIRIFHSQRKGTLSAKVNVSSKNCSAVSEERFWPKFVKCKPWKPASIVGKKLQGARNYSTLV